jgi:hypothetical protein
MKTFPARQIGIDSQGGGIALMEALHDPDKMFTGELPLWPIIDPEKEKDTDAKAGLHIVEMINFASADWTSSANHGMRKDFEDKVLIFPHFDPISIGLAIEDDAAAFKAGDKSRMYDSLEDCVMEIEELKNELAMIVMTITPNSNRYHWSTPETKDGTGKKGRMLKDRYTSLLIANQIARTIKRADGPLPYSFIGGNSRDMVHNPHHKGSLYESTNSWYKVEDGAFLGVVRGGGQ